jgi:hypothetical protein
MGERIFQTMRRYCTGSRHEDVGDRPSLEVMAQSPVGTLPTSDICARRCFCTLLRIA